MFTVADVLAHQARRPAWAAECRELSRRAHADSLEYRAWITEGVVDVEEAEDRAWVATKVSEDMAHAAVRGWI